MAKLGPIGPHEHLGEAGGPLGVDGQPASDEPLELSPLSRSEVDWAVSWARRASTLDYMVSTVPHLTDTLPHPCHPADQPRRRRLAVL